MKWVLLVIGLAIIAGSYSLLIRKKPTPIQQLEPQAAAIYEPQPEPSRVEPSRTWTFSRHAKIRISGGGAMSTREGGRLDASYVRRDETNVVVKLIDGGNGIIALMDLSDGDLDYLAALDGVTIDEQSLESDVRDRKDGLAVRSSQEAEVVSGTEEQRRAARKQWEKERAKKTAMDAAEKRRRDKEFWRDVNTWKRSQKPNWRPVNP